MKPMVTLTDRHPGPWPGQQEFLTVSSPHVAATVLKIAEKEQALVLRLVELAGRETTGKVRTVLADRPITFQLRSCEIKTILLPLDKKMPPREVSMIEGLS
jgi:alpha-mannosidase